MLKIFIEKWWVIVGVLLLSMYIYGYFRMYFYLDDLFWFTLMSQSLPEIMSSPLSEHINYLFKIFFKIEWNLIGFNFPPYLFISIAIHGFVVWLIYSLSIMTSGRKDLSAFVAILFTINTNWNEIVLWVSGQTVSFTVVFVLLSMIAIWKNRYQVLTIGLATMTSAIALGLPLAFLFTYGYKIGKWQISKEGWGVVGVILMISLIYIFIPSDRTAVEITLSSVVSIVIFWILSIINIMISRFFVPFDQFESVRLAVVILALCILVYKYKDSFRVIWADMWSRFLFLQIGIYYLVVATGRFQYGDLLIRTERFAYLGLALFFLLLVRIFRNVSLNKLIYLMPLLIFIQCLGFFVRAESYVIKPQRLKSLVVEIRATDQNIIKYDDYLPEYVFPRKAMRYKDLVHLINH